MKTLYNMGRLLFSLVLLTLVSIPAQAPENCAEAMPVQYELEMHSFHVKGTAVTFVFDRDKTLLIDCSGDRDPALLAAYLQAMGRSHVDLVLCTKKLLPDAYPFSVGAIYETESGTLPTGEGIALGATRVRFTERDVAPVAEIQYESTTYRFALQTETHTDMEEAMVLIRKTNPGAGYTDVSFRPLRVTEVI